jgi:hypothetical protein
MKRTALLTAIALAVSSLIAPIDMASAQQRCPFGHIGNDCINGPLVAGAQLQAIISTQQKFSYSVPLALNAPRARVEGVKPFDYREYYYYQQYQPGGTGGFFYSCHPHC